MTTLIHQPFTIPAADYCVKTRDIDDALGKLENNTKGITVLLNDLGDIVKNLTSALKIKSAAKEPMTELQIKAFSSFQSFYSDETAEISHELLRLSGLKKRVMSEIMSENADFFRLYNRLLNISKRQHNTISNLNNVISAARDTLELIA
jgi:hypothetical protein